jgi:hypothetical protein
MCNECIWKTCDACGKNVAREARAKLGLPEEVWGNLATARQEFDQNTPAHTISKSVGKSDMPPLSASARKVAVNGRTYVIAELPQSST